MNIHELEKQEMNIALAYALGLMYSLYKSKKIENKEYIVGSINHNPKMITTDEINQHFWIVNNLFETYLPSSKIELKTNQCKEYKLSSKKGFSIIVEKTGVTDVECEEVMTKRVKEIREATDEIKREFVKGCFDGRASWDTKTHYLSLDVDRKDDKQDLIIEIIESLGIETVKPNRRGEGHSRHDQIRIKSKSIRKYMTDINFYSTCRANIISNAINI